MDTIYSNNVKELSGVLKDELYSEESITNEKLLQINNTVADSTSFYDCHIYGIDELDNIYSGKKPSDIIRSAFRYYDGAKYFVMDDDNIATFYDSAFLALYDVLDTQNIAIYCIDNSESFGVESIQEIITNN